MSLNNQFLDHCNKRSFEINKNQIEIINELEIYRSHNFNQSLIKKIFKKKKESKPGFYLVGAVGVGKTMILNFFFDNIKEKKIRLHFNEFMIEFHDFIFKIKDKEDGIYQFVKNLKKRAKILYFDEFQVTNIVDAMILGKLFKELFEENIKVIFSSNIKIKDLYKDGLQREQFIPFIKILKEKSLELELSIDEDYRTNKKHKLERFLYPLDESTNFRFNKFFRMITKNKNHTTKILNIKGRKLQLDCFYDGVSKFDFDELFNKNLGSEDYIKISECCNFIMIEKLPDFNDNNSNQQQRFISFIDIIYEKKIPLMITSEINLKDINSSKDLIDSFKRTKSRLHELTSFDYTIL